MDPQTPQTKVLHPIFVDCCANQNGRYTVDRSFVKNGWRYATDGRIVVRESTDELETKVPLDCPPFPDCSSLAWTDPVIGIMKLPDAIDECVRERCECCRGSAAIECADPNCDFRHECACETGYHESEAADFYEILDGKLAVRISAVYLRLLIKHGIKDVELVKTDPQYVIRFNCAGAAITGLLSCGAFDEVARLGVALVVNRIVYKSLPC